MLGSLYPGGRPGSSTTPRAVGRSAAVLVRNSLKLGQMWEPKTAPGVVTFEENLA